MRIAKNENGEPCSMPDDLFDIYGKTLEEWLKEMPRHGVDLSKWFAARENVADAAVQCIADFRKYEGVRRNTPFLFLDMEPHVIEHYRIDLKPQYGSCCPLDLYFVFKERNNGDTFIVFHQIEEWPHFA